MMREENSTGIIPTDDILSSEPVFNYQAGFVHKPASV